VVPVPDSGVAAALGYSSNRCCHPLWIDPQSYVGRTFIEPEQRVRDFGVKPQVNPIRSLLTGSG